MPVLIELKIVAENHQAAVVAVDRLRGALVTSRSAAVYSASLYDFAGHQANPQTMPYEEIRIAPLDQVVR